MNIDFIFGKVVKALRIKKDISQEELAYQSNLDRTYISMLERGVNQPSLNTVLSVAKGLNMRASDLVRLIEIELEKNN
ncbi:helix-turn-helix domain-containing protein [Paenibacillus typhae]|uniref:DNA-binding transcriptional regulator, XRE-family HTH domain n=1 Tax=Paenibacillus typhae TaxID=1174501 RepID=A0A1G8X3Q6_9BACL|nr:helix-turn-helix transcriptional regulator [Paenibacillus typhae]SDJ84946.1 DNA-binding transcriptional regulator, XRE-family HTH domain [Paenibacillus typhae]